MILHLYSSIQHPHPISTLFTYTTLFLSICLPRAISVSFHQRKMDLQNRILLIVEFSYLEPSLKTCLGLHQCFQKSYQNLNDPRSEEHTSELQSRGQLVCRLMLEEINNSL